MNRFERAVSKLVKAYHNDELKRKNCGKCAVGNMLGNSYWSLLFHTNSEETRWMYEEYWDDVEATVALADIHMAYGYKNAADVLIDSIYESEYSIKELAMIEQRFETVGRKTGSTLEALHSIVELMASWENLDINVNQVKDRFVVA